MGRSYFPSPLTRTAEEQGRGWKTRNKISYFYLNLTLVITFKIFEYSAISAIFKNLLYILDCFYFPRHHLPFDDSPVFLSAVIPSTIRPAGSG